MLKLDKAAHNLISTLPLVKSEKAKVIRCTHLSSEHFYLLEKNSVAIG